MQRPNDEMKNHSHAPDYRALYHVLREKIWLLAFITALGVLAATFYLVRTQKTYEATTTIQIEEERQRVVRADRGVDDRSDEEALKTIAQNLENPTLMLRLVRHPELTLDPAFRARFPEALSETQLQRIFSRKVSVKIRRGTRLIDITIQDENPALAQKIAQLLVVEFIRASTESRAQISQGAHEYLRQEAERLKETLATSEAALQLYKEKHQAVSLEEKQNIVVERLKELNTKVTTAKAERLKVEADLTQLQLLAETSPARLLALPSVAGAAEVVEVQRKIGEKEAELATLSRRYKPEHPKYLEATAALAGLKVSQDQVVLNAAGLLGKAFEAAQSTEKKLEEALLGQERIALELSQMAIPYKALAREVEANRTLYESLIAQLKETEIAQGVSRYAIRLTAPALLPERPVKPNQRLVLVLGTLSGLAVGLSLVLGRHLLDSSCKTVDQAERLLGLPSLAAIPKQKRTVLAGSILIDKPHSALAEAFRTLRTSLRMAEKADGGKTVLFASAIPGEGKTFCAINCAVSFAQQGMRTLLIDADLRLPSIEKILLETKQAPGLSDLLLGEAHLGKAVHLTGIKNLSLLPAGKRVPEIAELFSRSELPAFLQRVGQDFDRIVIDTAPIHAVSDTLLLAPHVGVVCLVVRSGRAPGHALARAVELLRASGARIAGLVINALPSGHGGYYYHYHAPGYGRDEVYGASAALESAAQAEPLLR